MFGVTVSGNTIACNAAQLVFAVGAERSFSVVVSSTKFSLPARPIRPYADVASHDASISDHLGFMHHGNLAALCLNVRASGLTFPVG